MQIVEASILERLEKGLGCSDECPLLLPTHELTIADEPRRRTTAFARLGSRAIERYGCADSPSSAALASFDATNRTGPSRVDKA